MSAIRNSISLTDHFTPTLRSIMRAMDSTLKVMRDLDKAANNGVQSKSYRRAEKDIQRANNALAKMRNHTDMVGNAAVQATRKYRTLGQVAGSVANGFAAVGNSASYFMQSLASGVYLAQKLAKAVGGIMTLSDSSRSQVARLGLYNNSNESNEELYGKVFRTALDTRSDLTGTANLVNRILMSGVYSGADAAQSAIGTAGLINKALVAGGGTSEENNRALTQLTQGLASGVLQGDELRSIREQAPYLAQVLAEGLAQVDDRFAGIGIGDLKELGAAGELTADRVTKAFWMMQDEINADFEAMPKTFGQAVTSLSSIWQYFLWMLSDTDGPLGKINNRLWQFVDYLQSAEGLEFLNGVAVGIDAIATGLSWAMGAVGDFIIFLQENIPIAQALFIALGVAAVTAGISAAVSWIAATWPILLVAAAVFLVAWAFIEAGFTAQQVVGAIVGGVLWLVSVIWDAVIVIIVIVLYLAATAVILVIGAVSAIILAIQAVGQVITWVVMAIITVFWFLWTVVQSIGYLFKAGVQTLARFVVDRFHNMATNILDVLGVVAKAIDAVFGSDLSGTVDGWSTRLETTYDTVMNWIGDPSKTMDDLAQTWVDYGTGVGDMFTSDKYNLYDEMAGVWNGAGDLIGGTWDLAVGADNALAGLLINPNGAFDVGYDWGEGLVDGIGNFELGIPGSSVLDSMGDGVTVDGGYLDGIKSDVDISDEDVRLLRDMAARDYLLQLQSITPVANVTFGDVRETADVNKIVEVIEQMVDEQMATSLVS